MNNNKKILCRVLCFYVLKIVKRINLVVFMIVKIIVIVINIFFVVFLFGVNFLCFFN